MIKSYSVILPTLNEVGHIQKLILDISKIFNLNNTKYEIIVVDDNSSDGTIDVVRKIELNNENCNIYTQTASQIPKRSGTGFDEKVFIQHSYAGS